MPKLNRLALCKLAVQSIGVRSEGHMTCLQAAQPEAAQPKGPADNAQASASAEAVHNAISPDEQILQELDLAKAKPCLTRVCPAVCVSIYFYINFLD